ncbi:MAG: hypothetical protein AUK51_13995 [Comamonadaceae bacterium CG2_30_59_20]|nr:MAG: hypothetical protein AUK51_13995 [Comamonadaceae bacterium CG2_30_59_20]
MNTTRYFFICQLALLALCTITSTSAQAFVWSLKGVHTITAHTQDKRATVIGTVSFTPLIDGSSTFVVTMDYTKFSDYFLSMKEFKCLSSPVEVTCHVPYPYRHPGKVTLDDLTWLEHNLLFLFKRPSEFGAKLWNGLYYRFTVTDTGLVGQPMAIDLNLISAPPDDLKKPTFTDFERVPFPKGVRWIESISIE